MRTRVRLAVLDGEAGRRSDVMGRDGGWFQENDHTVTEYSRIFLCQRAARRA